MCMIPSSIIRNILILHLLFFCLSYWTFNNYFWKMFLIFILFYQQPTLNFNPSTLGLETNEETGEPTPSFLMHILDKDGLPCPQGLTNMVAAVWTSWHVCFVSETTFSFAVLLLVVVLLLCFIVRLHLLLSDPKKLAILLSDPKNLAARENDWAPLLLWPYI